MLLSLFNLPAFIFFNGCACASGTHGLACKFSNSIQDNEMSLLCIPFTCKLINDFIKNKTKKKIHMKFKICKQQVKDLKKKKPK